MSTQEAENFLYGEYQIGFSSNAVETMAHGRTGIQMKNPIELRVYQTDRTN